MVFLLPTTLYWLSRSVITKNWVGQKSLGVFPYTVWKKNKTEGTSANPIQDARCLKTRNSSSHSSGEAPSLDQCQQGHAPFEIYREPFLVSSWFAAAGWPVCAISCSAVAA